MNTQGWRVGSLFAGIGGFDLAARNVGWRTVWVSEIHPYASRVLARHFPDAPNHGDITQIDFTKVEPVEVLCGGFPCQDISVAGKGAGIDGSRSGLWGHYARAIGVLRPRYVVVENVAALLARGLGRVLGDLATLGYDAEWHCIPATAVGAPHRRDRLWVVAYPDRVASDTVGRAERDTGAYYRQPGAASGAQCLPATRGAALADPASLGPPGPGKPVPSGHPAATGAGKTSQPFDGGLAGQWATEPDVGRVAHGVPARVDRLTGLGNAIVPQVAEVLFRAIQAHEEGQVT